MKLSLQWRGRQSRRHARPEMSAGDTWTMPSWTRDDDDDDLESPQEGFLKSRQSNKRFRRGTLRTRQEPAPEPIPVPAPLPAPEPVPEPIFEPLPSLLNPQPEPTPAVPSEEEDGTLSSGSSESDGISSESSESEEETVTEEVVTGIATITSQITGPSGVSEVIVTNFSTLVPPPAAPTEEPEESSAPITETVSSITSAPTFAPTSRPAESLPSAVSLPLGGPIESNFLVSTSTRLHAAHPTAGVTGRPTESVTRDAAEDTGPNRHEPDAAERAVHVLGAIAGFFFLAGLLWFLWRTFRRARAKRNGVEPTSTRDILSRRVPFFGKFSEKSEEQQPKAAWEYPTASEEKLAAQAQWPAPAPEPQQSFGVNRHMSGPLGKHPLPPAYEGQPSRQPRATISTIAPRPPGPFARKRSSEVSSLSSGFGDQDIVVPVSAESTLRTQASRGAPDDILEGLTPPPAIRRASVMSRTTDYTDVSEDPLPRFRNINSWVRQQTGRVRRQKSRDEEDPIPPMPSMPAEPEFVMMMSDGEEPRRANQMYMDDRDDRR